MKRRNNRMTNTVFIVSIQRPYSNEFVIAGAFSNCPSCDEIKESYCDVHALDSVGSITRDVDYKITHMNVINN